MTIAQAFNEIAIAQGGTASTSGTIAGAIDALNDALAGSDQDAASTIEDAVRLLGQHVGGGSTPTGTIEITENGEGIDVAQYAYADVNVSGGGSGDFSFAEVTLNITPPEGVEIEGEIIHTEFEYPSDSFAYECTWSQITNHKANIILYQGAAYIDRHISCYSSEYDYPLDVETITTSGNIEYDDDKDIFIVTGDGTISGSYTTMS